MQRKRIPESVMDKILRIARIKATLPAPKELAAEAGVNVRNIQYHLHKATLREKRLAHCDVSREAIGKTISRDV